MAESSGESMSTGFYGILKRRGNLLGKLLQRELLSEGEGLSKLWEWWSAEPPRMHLQD